jgi:hypothetical protein
MNTNDGRLPALPDVARGILKALIVSLANTGLISQADADTVIALLGLHDA